MAGRWKLGSILIAGLVSVGCGGGGGGSNGGNQGGGTVDTTPPVVLNTNPSNQATGVPINATLTASFSESITAPTPATAFTLAQGGTPVPGTVSFAGGTASFAPGARLGNNLSYQATVTSGIRDLAGNPLATSFNWTFITSDCNAITLLRQFTPALGASAVSAGFKALATDGTSIYLWTQTDFTATFGTVFKLDPATGAVLSSTAVPLVPLSATTPVHGIQFVADIAWHNGALWASGSYHGANGSLLQGVFRINLGTGLAESELPIAPGLTGENPFLQGLACDGTNLYVAIDRIFQPPTATSHIVVKLNPATSTQVPLSPALLITSGQATRLDYGGGFLWVFNNPGFQQVEPSTGAVLVTYCKTDGGPNILFLNANIWSIKDSVLMAYGLP